MSILNAKLTPHTPGSVRELWAISFPIILSILSINVMTFVDRLMLSKYNTQAMNAAVVAGLVFSLFQCGTIGIASISEVFVGQCNGAKKLKRIGEPVWQMIWFSVMTAFLFIPLGLWAGPLFMTNAAYLKDGVPFFKWMMLFGPTFPMVAALSSFFIGRGQVTLVTITIVLSNVLNILLDLVLIFGVSKLGVPALGASGAALATGISQLVQVFVLFGFFLSPVHRKMHGTGVWQFKPKLFFQALQVGSPNAISSVIEVSAWCILSQILATVSEAHITIFSIGDSFFTLFSFGFWGLQKGITTLVANYIGANQEDMIGKCLKSGIKSVVAMMMIFTIPLFFFPESLVQQFLNPENSGLINEELMSYAVGAMRWLWVYFMLDAIAWLICGVLTAAGDTKFVMMMNGISAWVFSVIPTYFFLVYMGGSPVTTWVLCALYGFLNVISFYLRFRSRRWLLMQPLHAY